MIGLISGIVSAAIESGSFLVFEADHFSFYVICPVDTVTGEPIDDLLFGDAYCAFNGRSYEEKVTKISYLKFAIKILKIWKSS
ncbi:MAG: hypothetical protein ACI4W6_10370 [Acutalibacteraceae bacterium]